LDAPLVAPVDDAGAAVEETALVLADALCPKDGVAVAVALAARETSFAQVTFSGTE
jgi:hypothetical protein